MQTVYVIPNQNYNLLDALNYYVHEEGDNGLYVLYPQYVEPVTFAIYSLHEPKLNADVKSEKSIGVISYIPDMNSTEWPTFYINLCLAEIIACDSAIHAQMSSMSFPKKAWVNLDGINPLVKAFPNEETPDGIPMYVVSNNPVFSGAYREWLNKRVNTDENPIQLRVVTDPQSAIVVLGMKPFGQLISNTLSINKRVWLAYDPIGSLFLDSRLTHTYLKQISQINEIAGSVQSQMVASLFESMTEELSNLLAHASVSPVPAFYSSETLVSRILNHLNRAY
mgnify:CR=1 FL=1